MIEIPAGMQGEIYSKLNDFCGGRVESKIVRNVKV